MKLIRRIDIMNDKKTIWWLNIVSIPLLIVFICLFWGLASITKVSEPIRVVESGITGLILIVLSFFLLIVIHELIHGLFFKLFSPEGNVKFGFKNGMAYATSPHSFYSRGKFAWIAVAPFVLITLLLYVFLYIGLISSGTFVWVSALHASACVGDFYWLYLIKKQAANVLVEDTEVGISFYERIS